MRTYENRTNCIDELNQTIKNQLTSNNVEVAFPAFCSMLKENDFSIGSSKRKDFRGEKAFTIDCAETKDIDDAVSVCRNSRGYRLAVHIADVSEYVRLGSELDKIAVDRATSFYLPNLTIPMLPAILSSDLCSLNPGVDRKTLSVVMYINNNGDVISHEITKGLIRSRVKGVYTEVNSIISNNSNKYLDKKYHEVKAELEDMVSLSRILRAKRIRNGANIIDSSRPKIVIGKNRIDIIPSHSGAAEKMIEEFMIIANTVVAEYLYNNNLPAIFRVQAERKRMAGYQFTKLHHADLALENYSHYTSPIRRISDLKVHQIISMHLAGIPVETIHSIFDEQLVEVCDRATKRSRTSKAIQKYVETFCFAEYFKYHSNERFEGEIVGFNHKNLPIVRVDAYNINILGYAIINGKLNDKYTFTIGVSNTKNELFASRIRRESER